MIQEAYCSFEVAKLLKEKGFNEGTHKYYENGELKWSNSPWLEIKYNSLYTHTNRISAPTHQMALAWLREKNIFIELIRVATSEGIQWGYKVNDMPTNKIVEEFAAPVYKYSTYKIYEEAVEASLIYSLENLI